MNQLFPLSAMQRQLPISCEYAGGRYKLTTKGLTFIGTDKDGKEMPPRWICSPLYVVAKTRDAKSGEWGRLLEWQDDDGVKHQWAMPLALLQGDASEVRRELARLGLTITTSKSGRDFLTSYLQVFSVEARARCVDKLGWHNDVFVTSTESIGQSSELVVFQNSHAIEPALSIAGTVDDWRDSVSRLASGNSRLIFALSAAFAPSLAKMMGEDSGGFHFRGTSSSGKTTALKMAASVWGNPAIYPRLWRTTANGLEGLAALHNDGLLILDELSQIDPKEAGEAAYLLANDQGKTRATRHGTAKQSMRWSLFFLSAGEESLTALMARAGQMLRVARRFALVAAAGELATQYGLTGWLQGESFRAAYECFKTWLLAFGWQGNREDRVILSQVRSFFESHGASRFDNIRTPNNDRINHRAGFYRTAENGDREYLVLSEVFRNEICHGFDQKVVARVLLHARWLEPARDGSASQKLRVRGVGIPRLYVFTEKLWSDE